MLTLSCKKEGKQADKPKQIVSFSYSGYNETDGTVSVEWSESFVSIQIEKFNGTVAKGAVNIQIENYSGPGVYNLGEKVRMLADNGNSEGYWQHYYYDSATPIYGSGSVIIEKLTNDRIEATVNGTLFHNDGLNPRTETTVKATIASFR